MTKQNRSSDDGFFVVTRVHRDDLAAAGFDIRNIDDRTMSRVASRMHDGYTEHGFWFDLEAVADLLDIPRRKGR